MESRSNKSEENIYDVTSIVCSLHKAVLLYFD